MDPLHDLNKQQQEAVTAEPGQVLVLAGPGSGKTRVLTSRIAYLVYKLDVPPYRINAVTFTNRAAREMRRRLETLLGEAVEGLWLGTFHAICAKILRREAEYLPFTSNYVIYDADDQISLVKNILKELNLDDKLFRPTSMHAAISNAKNNLTLPEDYSINTYRDEIVLRIYERYQQLLLGSNALDFDDLLLWTAHLFDKNPQICERYARRFEHILVDEFQDTNYAQYYLLKQFSSHHHSMFVVGDEDQSIYRWRGADYRNVLRFEEDYPDCQKYLLEQNYRSGQNILDVARAVIDCNRNRTPKGLFTARGAGEKILFFEADDDRAEAAFTVETIQKQVSEGRAKGADFAIMYRTNAQSRLVEDAFMRIGMPYRLVGAQRFYGRREIKDVIAFLRLVHNPADEISLQRVINVPPRKIGGKTLNALQHNAQLSGSRSGVVLIDLGQHGDQSPYYETFSNREIKALIGFGEKLAGWRLAADQRSLTGMIDLILDDVNYREYLEDGSGEGLDRWGNVDELRRMAFEYEQSGLGMSEFLENLALVSDQDTIPDQQDVPTLLTLHAAKGLEFDQVFIIGLDDGLLPHARSIDDGDPEEMAEERRLFYVGITRTRNKLFLLNAKNRFSFEQSKLTRGKNPYIKSLPSRFLDDIP
ncbi:MAG: UvrD-helicase domain-containing protein, partial [Anaerolineaceae bacterium]|nr:UvrD-helicase domain-containing protein [Anaerolineaceae bacterium]